MTETVTWIDPDGAQYLLDVQWNVSGRFMPKIEFETNGVPGQPGEFFRFARHGTHEFMLPFDVVGTSESDLRSDVRQMVSVMDPARGLGRIRVTSPVGDQREIWCRVSSGLELQETLGEASGPTWQRFPLSFIAHDPYWYDVNATSNSFTIEPNTANFFPFFPLKLTSSEIAVDDMVTNNGDVDAWPLWTITGPGSTIKLSNLTTGKYIYFPSGSLLAGQYISIDTRPGYKSVTYDDGSNAYPAMSSGSSLWPLVRGTNTIRLEMSGSVALTSALSLTFYQRYLTP